MIKYKFDSRRVDLHAHTRRSAGLLGVEDSINKRLLYAETIGVSDHYKALIKRNNLWDIYVKQINSYKRVIKTHEIMIGTEIKFVDLCNDIDEALDEKLNDLDFIIVEYYEKASKELFIEIFTKLRKKFSKPIILAHPDYTCWLFLLKKEDFRNIFNNVGKVANLLNKFNIPIIISTDAHGYENALFKRFERVYKFLMSFKD